MYSIICLGASTINISSRFLHHIIYSEECYLIKAAKYRGSLANSTAYFSMLHKHSEPTNEQRKLNFEAYNAKKVKLGYLFFDLALTQPYLLLFSASRCAAVYYKFHQSPDIDLASATSMTDQRRSRPCEWISAASAVASLERRLASQTPARRIAHTHARTGRYCGTR